MQPISCVSRFCLVLCVIMFSNLSHCCHCHWSRWLFLFLFLQNLFWKFVVGGWLWDGAKFVLRGKNGENLIFETCFFPFFLFGMTEDWVSWCAQSELSGINGNAHHQSVSAAMVPYCCWFLCTGWCSARVSLLHMQAAEQQILSLLWRVWASRCRLRDRDAVLLCHHQGWSCLCLRPALISSCFQSRVFLPLSPVSASATILCVVLHMLQRRDSQALVH